MSIETTPIHVHHRFNGPPGSANGGYMCGRMAEHTGAPCVETRLMAPPPLDTDLPLRHDNGEWFALHEQQPVARARAGDLADLTVPTPPSVDEARAAEARFSGFVDHPFPRCYVCGPDRDDGLRLFPGWLDDHRAVACHWVPGKDLDSGDGRVDLPNVYAALDCAGSFTLEKDPDTWMVLGNFTVQVDERPRVGDAQVVTGWFVRRDARKHFAGTALHDATGRCLARALAVWVQIPAGSR